MARTVLAQYVDPLDEIWIAAAGRIGLTVVRTADAYATTDGNGTLALGNAEQLDADDSVGQMVFHELCHSLVQGPDSFARTDWGMDNTSEDDVWREHACLLVQWVLSGRHGLRGLMAPTTDFRAFWDQLDGDVLADRAHPSVRAAILALDRADTAPWAPALGLALTATAQIAAALRAVPPAPPSLWALVTAPPAPHPSGLPAGAADTDRSCGGCAWRYQGGPGKRATRCRQADGRRIDDAWPGCERFEPAATLDCLTCGACCREAYGAVEVRPREAFVKLRPDFVVWRGDFLEVKRAGNRCAALGGGNVVTTDAGALTTTPYACSIYDDRPRTCREFTMASDNCLTARRRVGLSL